MIDIQAFFSAVGNSVGARTGEGKVLRTLASSLGGERSEADVVRFFFLCFVRFFVLEEDEELDSASVSPTGVLLV